jgi:GT2 family glycosyltransferase
VAVVVLNYQGWQDTLACVASLLREGSGLAMSVIVCDNASPNGSLKHLRQGMSAGLSDGPELLTLSRAQAEAGQGACAPPSTTWQQLVLIDNEGNLGFAAGCNVGIRWACHAGADFVWLLNNDTEVAPNALGALVSHMQASPTMGLCGSKLVYHDDRHCIQARGGAVFDPLTGQGTWGWASPSSSPMMWPASKPA